MGVVLEWAGGQSFRGRTDAGAEVVVDGERRAGASPTDTLLVAFAACMGIDIVDILTKGRQDVRACVLRVDGARRDAPPRRFTAIALDVELTGVGLSRDKAERAIELSRTTYCSVWATLAPDVGLDIRLSILEAG